MTSLLKYQKWKTMTTVCDYKTVTVMYCHLKWNPILFACWAPENVITTEQMFLVFLLPSFSFSESIPWALLAHTLTSSSSPRTLEFLEVTALKEYPSANPSLLIPCQMSIHLRPLGCIWDTFTVPVVIIWFFMKNMSSELQYPSTAQNQNRFTCV